MESEWSGRGGWEESKEARVGTLSPPGSRRRGGPTGASTSVGRIGEDDREGGSGLGCWICHYGLRPMAVRGSPFYIAYFFLLFLYLVWRLICIYLSGQLNLVEC